MAKLTLIIDDEVFRRASKFAKEQNVPLSKIVELYLIKIVQKDNSDIDSIHGIIDLELDYDDKKAIRKYFLKDTCDVINMIPLELV